MRNNLKHLLLGMSLGAVVVFIYGLLTLKPQVKIQHKIARENSIHKSREVSVEELIKPNIAKQINIDLKKEVQFSSINKLYNNNLEKEKDDHPQIASDDNPTQDTNDVKETEANDIAEKLIKPEVAFYIYKNVEQDQITNPFQLHFFASQEEQQTPTPTPETTPTIKQVAVYSSVTNEGSNTSANQYLEAPENVITLIEKYAQEFGVDKNMMIGIAKCESGFRENAVNGPYAGIYQFVSGTWVSNRRAMGLDENIDLRYNAEESIRTAAFKMSRDGFGAWPVCQYKAQGLVASAENI